jgi:hippurate hydrolase
LFEFKDAENVAVPTAAIPHTLSRLRRIMYNSTMNTNDFSSGGQFSREIVRFRHDLHKIPELDRELPKTTSYLKQYLSKLPCTITDITNAGFCALFEAKTKVDTSIAFRTDMDALPITESNQSEYCSTHPGKMHACGHDGHMSVMLGFATWISENLESLKKNVLLVFQAAEETTGGAKDFCASTIFKDHKTERIYGLHLWPGYPKGTVICRKGDFMASTLVFSVAVQGKSTHVGTFREGIDALEIGADFLLKIYQMEREIPQGVKRLLRVGRFESGKTANVVSSKTILEGTLRTYSDEVREETWAKMLEIANDLEKTTGCKFSFRHSEPYPAVINPPGLFEEAKKTLIAAGYPFFEPEEPLVVAEDFGCYMKMLPALFLHLGTGSETPLHSSNYTLDEDVLIEGVNIFRLLLELNQK